MELFAKKLRARIASLGLTHAEVARQSGLTERAFSHYVTAQREPNLPTLLRIAATLDTTPNNLLGVGSSGSSTKDPAAKLRQRISGTCNTLDLRRLSLVDALVQTIASHDLDLPPKTAKARKKPS